MNVSTFLGLSSQRRSGSLTNHVPFSRFRRRATKNSPIPNGKRTCSRPMVLAIKFDGMIRAGRATAYADLARLGLLIRARMTQLVNVLNLAPDIQEQILFLAERAQGKEPIAEQNLRQLLRIVLWGGSGGCGGNWREPCGHSPSAVILMKRRRSSRRGSK